MGIPRLAVVVRVSVAVIALSFAWHTQRASVALAQMTSSTCIGDCSGSRTVAVDELVMLVNISLGIAAASACPHGIPADEPMTIAMIVQAVDNALNGCRASGGTETPTATVASTIVTPPGSTPTATPTPIASPNHFCDLPGSVQSTAPGLAIVPGGPAGTPDLSFLHLPVGFCAHFFAGGVTAPGKIGNTRQLRFAPGGELFVASPTTSTTGGGPGGKAAILVLADDDHDGFADAPITFLSGIPSTQGLLFTGGYLYYQDSIEVEVENGKRIIPQIKRVPYTAGDRTPSAESEVVAEITVYFSSLHWPKALDADDDGTIYVANGGDEGERCDRSLPFHGGILKLDGAPGGTPVARGFRNPISIRCARGYNLCFAIELTKDYSTPVGGREKLVPIRQGDDWGFPCCATKDVPFPNIHPVPDCSGVSTEIDSFYVGNTPFDLDFETGKWPEPWTHRAFVPLHGAYGTWQGARLVGIDFDTMTGLVLPGSDLGGMSTGAMADFATGWDDNTNKHGRPANVAFAPDGRLFLGNDNNGHIIWIAPMDLEQ